MSFVNKVVVVTGAGSGIGAVIAQKFAELNATLALIDINNNTLAKVAVTCEKLTKGKVLKVVVDLTKDEELKKGVANLLKQFGKIDVLINSAGIHIPGRIEDVDILEKFDKVWSVNVRSMVAMTSLATPALKASKGTVINLACCNVESENSIAYIVSSAGIIKFTRGAAVELAKYGIRVNSISPGAINDTNILFSAGISESMHHEFFEALREKTLLKIFVDAEVIAELAVFLASEKAHSITGSDFVADAGLHVRTVNCSPSATEF